MLTCTPCLGSLHAEAELQALQDSGFAAAICAVDERNMRPEPQEEVLVAHEILQLRSTNAYQVAGMHYQGKSQRSGDGERKKMLWAIFILHRRAHMATICTHPHADQLSWEALRSELELLV